MDGEELDKIYECNDCVKDFPRRHHLKRHTETHTDKSVQLGKVLCDNCEKAFTSEQHLKRHAKSHTHEPVHRCKEKGCKKAYVLKETLTRHSKENHLGQDLEGPVWCNQCGKYFQRKNSLRKHKRSIHRSGGMREDSRDPDNRSSKDEDDRQGFRGQCNGAVRARGKMVIEEANLLFEQGNEAREEKCDDAQQSGSFMQSRGSWYKDRGCSVDAQMRGGKEQIDASIIVKDHRDYDVTKV